MACRTYKRFLEPKEVYLGDNTIVYAQGQGTQLLQIGPYILVLLFGLCLTLRIDNGIVT